MRNCSGSTDRWAFGSAGARILFRRTAGPTVAGFDRSGRTGGGADLVRGTRLGLHVAGHSIDLEQASEGESGPRSQGRVQPGERAHGAGDEHLRPRSADGAGYGLGDLTRLEELARAGARGELGVDHARVDRGQLDGLVAQLEPDRLGEPAHGVLGGRVGGLARAC